MTRRSHGFISVGAACQALLRVLCVAIERIVLFVLRLKCSVKRREALRGRNLSRDSRASGAPMVHLASGVLVAPEAVFLTLIGHPNDASENPLPNCVQTVGSSVCVICSGYRHCHVVALDSRGGIGGSVLRRRSGATRRVDSFLRSHRTRRSYCRRVYSGLNKTLFASIGPNLRWRGHQLRCPATPGRSFNCATWSDPIAIDSTYGGAYPSMVNLNDGSVLVTYHEEGAGSYDGNGSDIRARRIEITGLPEPGSLVILATGLATSLMILGRKAAHE